MASTAVAPRAGLLHRLAHFIPPWALVIISLTSVQIGAGLAKTLFDVVTPSGMVFLRTIFAGVLFTVLWRPTLRHYTRLQWLYAIIYGINIAMMMLTFYSAIRSVPLGIAVALAFLGPLAVAVLGSRKPLDLLWVALAGLGVFLLAPNSEGGVVEVRGLLLVFLSGFTWAYHILISKRMTRVFNNSNSMLGLTMLIAALTAAPFGLGGALNLLHSGLLLALTALVSVFFSAVVPYWSEFEAIKRISPRTISLLLSLEPVVGMIVGGVILSQALDTRAVLGIICVTVAAAATARGE